MSWWRMATNGQRIPTPLGMSRSVFMAGTMTGTWNWRVGKEPWSKTCNLRSEYANTLVTELDLVCDYAQWPHISTSLFYVGSLLGNIIFGNIADRFTKLHILIKCKIEIQIWSANGLLPPPVHGNQPRCCHRVCPKLHRLHYPQASLSVIWGDQFIYRWIDGTESWTYTATKSQTKHSLSIEA